VHNKSIRKIKKVVGNYITKKKRKKITRCKKMCINMPSKVKLVFMCRNLMKGLSKQTSLIFK
jgi:hypothetical protein